MLNNKTVFVYGVDGCSRINRFNSIYEVVDHIKEKYGEVPEIGITASSKTCIFLDDERIIGDVTWVDYPKYWAVHTIRTFDEFKKHVVGILNLVYPEQEAIAMLDFSFDHDIQCFDAEGNETTGYDCVKWLCDYCLEKKIDLDKLSYVVHSQNPVGKENIITYIENCKAFQNGH